MNTANSGWRQLVGGIVVGLVSVTTVLASVLLASQESVGLVPTSIAFVTPSTTATRVSTLPPSASFTPGVASPTSLTSLTMPASTPTPGPTATPAPATACPVPTGWSAYIVRAGDSIESIAWAVATNVYGVIQGNCLVNTDVTPGQTLYLPPSPTRGPTPTRVPCGPPINWVFYRVQPGDTLYGLSVRHGISVYALAQANCMTGYLLRAGQTLYVPPVIVIPPTSTATRTPPATPSFTPSLTPPSPSATATGVVPSRTPTATVSVIPTTPSPTTGPSSTPSSATPTASDTPQSPTPTVAPSVTPSPTLRPSATASATSSATASATPLPTLTSPAPTSPPPSSTP